jgi:hypothetical protein
MRFCISSVTSLIAAWRSRHTPDRPSRAGSARFAYRPNVRNRAVWVENQISEIGRESAIGRRGRPRTPCADNTAVQCQILFLESGQPFIRGLTGS